MKRDVHPKLRDNALPHGRTSRTLFLILPLLLIGFGLPMMIICMICSSNDPSFKYCTEASLNVSKGYEERVVYFPGPRLGYERPRVSKLSTFKTFSVINLGCEDSSQIVQKVGDACKNYGLFQVINHSVSLEAVANEFIRLPALEKSNLYSENPSTTMRLSISFNVNKEKVHNWRDYFKHPSYPLEKSFTILEEAKLIKNNNYRAYKQKEVQVKLNEEKNNKAYKLWIHVRKLWLGMKNLCSENTMQQEMSMKRACNDPASSYTAPPSSVLENTDPASVDDSNHITIQIDEHSSSREPSSNGASSSGAGDGSGGGGAGDGLGGGGDSLGGGGDGPGGGGDDPRGGGGGDGPGGGGGGDGPGDGGGGGDGPGDGGGGDGPGDGGGGGDGPGGGGGGDGPGDGGGGGDGPGDGGGGGDGPGGGGGGDGPGDGGGGGDGGDGPGGRELRRRVGERLLMFVVQVGQGVLTLLSKVNSDQTPYEKILFGIAVCCTCIGPIAGILGFILTITYPGAAAQLTVRIGYFAPALGFIGNMAMLLPENLMLWVFGIAAFTCIGVFVCAAFKGFI